MNKKYICRLCGKTPKERRYFFAFGKHNEYLCDKCVSYANMLMSQAYAKDGRKYNWIYDPPIIQSKEKGKNGFTPEKIKAYLDGYIIGQEEAKKVVSVAIYNHKKRMASKSKKIKKSNILLVGPTGSGKTLIAQTIAKRFDVPFVIADATSYTQSGYIGKDVDEILTRLLHAANNNVKRAERGIVYIDEIDKIARKTASGAVYSRDPSGEGVQQALLKIMEGTTLQIPVNTGNSMFVETVEFNTNNVLFICGGAFEGLNDTEMTVSGFCLTDDSKPIRSKEKVTPDALKKYGMIPELIGRLPIIVQLSALGEEDLIHVMRDTKDSILKEYMTLFSMDGIKLTFAKSALEEIAKLAIELKTGARGIRSIIEDTMLEMMYNLPSQKNVAEVLVTKETIYTKRGKLRYKNEVNADFGV